MLYQIQYFRRNEMQTKLSGCKKINRILLKYHEIYDLNTIIRSTKKSLSYEITIHTKINKCKCKFDNQRPKLLKPVGDQKII